MASRSRRIQNAAGAANSFLNAIDKPNAAETKVAKAVAASGKSEKMVSAMLAAVKQMLDDSDIYQKKLDSKSIDVTLGRIASLLDEAKEQFVKNELDAMKTEILDEISGLTTSGILKSFLLSQITALFDNDAKKEDIEELKQWLSDNFQAKGNTQEESSGKDELPSDQAIESKSEDEKEGDYQDSTPAKNFMTLQNVIEKQFNQLNKTLKSITVNSGLLAKMSAAIGAGFVATFSGIAKLTKGVAKAVGKTTSLAKSISKMALGGIAAAIGGIAKGVGSVIKGIGGLGKKIGGAIASPFKKIGGFFSAMNPFKRSEQKREERKQKAKDKIMEVMAKVIDKIWKVIEPFVDKVAFFMGLVTKFVIVPIALLVLKVLFIVGAIIALAVGLVLAAIWIKNKIMKFWNYIVSGELWEDIKSALVAAWDALKKTLYDYIVQPFVKYIWNPIKNVFNRVFGYFMSIVDDFKNGRILAGLWKILKGYVLGVLAIALYPITLALVFIKPLRDKVFEFIEMVKLWWNNKVWPIIEPFVKSLTELKDKIVQAFSAWDTNKSIWDNLKNIGGIIIDAIGEWWETSPFKVLWDDKVWPMLEPFITSLTELKDRIVQAFSAWNPEVSIWDNLKNISGIIVSSVSEWYEKSPFKKVIDNYVVAPLKVLRQKIVELLLKLSEFTIKLPSGIDVKHFDIGIWDIPIPVGIKWKDVKPFGSLASALGNVETAMPTPPNASQIQEAAASQVQNAAQPIRQLEQLDSNDVAELESSGKDISNVFEQKEKEQQQFNQDQSNVLNAIRNELNVFKSEALKKLDDPAAVPVPIPVNSQQNPAMMRRN